MTITHSFCDEAVNSAPVTVKSVATEIQPQKRAIGLGLNGLGLSDCDTPSHIGIGHLHSADLDAHAYAPTYSSGYLSSGSGSGYLSSGSGSGYLSSGTGYLSSGTGYLSSGSGYLSSGSGYLSSGSGYLSSDLCKIDISSHKTKLWHFWNCLSKLCSYLNKSFSLSFYGFLECAASGLASSAILPQSAISLGSSYAQHAPILSSSVYSHAAPIAISQPIVAHAPTVSNRSHNSTGFLLTLSNFVNFIDFVNFVTTGIDIGNSRTNYH